MCSRHVLYGLLLLFINAAAAACERPSLVIIAAEHIGDDTAQLIAGMQRYVAGTKDYMACVQAELTAAGGDAAPTVLRNVLIRRNNAAVAEAEAVATLFTERVAPLEELYLAEFIAGSGEECVSTFRLERTAVIDDLAVLFIERDGRAHLNVLEAICLNLGRYGLFAVHREAVGESDRVTGLGPVQTNRLCTSEFIYPYAAGGSQSRSDECALGRFFELTAEQKAQLLQGPVQGGAAAEPAAE